MSAGQEEGRNCDTAFGHRRDRHREEGNQTHIDPPCLEFAAAKGKSESHPDVENVNRIAPIPFPTFVRMIGYCSDSAGLC